MGEMTAKQQKERYWAHIEQRNQKLEIMNEIYRQSYDPTDAELVSAIKKVWGQVREEDFDTYWMEPEDYKAYCMVCDAVGVSR